MKRWLLLPLCLLCIATVLAQQVRIERPDGTTLTTAAIDKTIQKLMDTAEVFCGFVTLRLCVKQPRNMYSA